jgi:serpin B
MRKLLPGLLIFLAACQQTPERRTLDPATRAIIAKHDADVPALVEGNTNFAVTLYRQLAGREGNLFFSPYSTSNALAMTYAGARGNTAAEMKATLRFRLNDDTLHPTFGNLILKLEGDGTPQPVQLDVANRLWGQKDFGFAPGFLKISRDFYDGGLAEVDYTNNADAARNTINAWVARQTRNKINDLIPARELTAATRLVLTNAIYFKAPWEKAFDASATRPDTFYLLGGAAIQTPMMSATKGAPFADLESLSLVELPYKGHQQSMIVILPKKNDGLSELEKELTAENLTAWLAKLSGHEVDLKLPKFKVTAEFKLNDALAQMGMHDAFDQGKADFSGMATGERLFLSAVLHKAFIDVNEKETEAAAATAVGLKVGAAPRQVVQHATFHADHPFVFLIRDRASGSILFLGRVMSPVAN